MLGQPISRSRAFLGRARLSGTPLVLTDATFSQALAAPKAVVDFWSPSCPHCVAYKPVFEQVAGQVGSDILMVSANVNDAMQSAVGFKISSIPATIFLVGGKEVNRVEGEMSQADLLSEIARAFGGGSAPGAAPASFGIGTLALVGGGLAAAGLAAYLAFR